MKRLLLLTLACALLFLSACGSGTSSTPTSSTDASAQFSGSQSNSVPSSDEAQPYVIPDPIVYTGSGDDVIVIEPFDDDIWVLTITGNSEGRHFAVKGYDDASNSTELFVNTTNPYHGTTLDPSLSTSLLEISATGDWTIVLRSAYEMETISAGQTISGTGDSVLNVIDAGKTAYITGNTDSHHFAVKSYGFESNSLMVNTTDPYEGTVMLKGDPFLMTVSAEGDWTITFD